LLSVFRYATTTVLSIGVAAAGTSRLGELGLSSYEENSYHTLLLLGRATATGLADASDVPKGRIYDVFNGLAARDIVHPIGTNPRAYEAVAPDLAATMPAESRFWTALLGSDEAISLVGDVFKTADSSRSTVGSTASTSTSKSAQSPSNCRGAIEGRYPVRNE
jgi:hypothetical protein